ncbi:HNH endonuclease signature motif containing protein [Mesorhizobium sp. BE184]|uniref:HNH endonuclease n=1 Tax=Mesorhizobium sp. BE184 TaxID=2817714 RepID=UPI00285E5160|nr:HNH endonuclease signature motif containing protein [Mesorhizobium sp. BE184]MDR7032924.1 trigger factor [Mesorhizobium sp. BE184]
MGERYIPQDTQRAVRQKCRFGCIICGSPIFQYHHVQPFESVRRHEVENLVLLCGTHHDQVTRGQITEAVIKEYSTSPHNLRAGFTSGAIAGRYSGCEGVILLGEMGFTYEFETDGVGVAISIGGRPVLFFSKEGRALLLSMELFEPGAGIVLKIVRGEMVIATGVWDYRYEGRTLRIWSEQFTSVVEMTFSDRGPSIQKGVIKGRHTVLGISANGLSVNGVQAMAGFSLHNGCLHFPDDGDGETLIAGGVVNSR